jgi:hypothetical protein
MTEEEREQLARLIYETVTVHAGYYAPAWITLRDHEKVRWQRAADNAHIRLRQLGYRRGEGRRVA